MKRKPSYTQTCCDERGETPVMLELQIESQMQSEREGLCEKHIPNDTEEGHSFFFSIGFHDKKRRTKA